MQIKDIINSQQVLERVMEHKLPAKVAYAIAKNIKVINIEMEVFGITRNKLLKEKFKLDKVTKQYKIPPKEEEEWQKTVNELASVEIKLDPYMIDIEMLANVEITPGELMAISWMITDSEK